MPPRNRRGRRSRPTTEDADIAEDAEFAAEEERGPLRRCLLTRARGERGTMLRFVRAPDGRIVPDIAATLPGRGFWLSARGDVIETARVRGAFARAARGQVSVPPDLRAMVDAALVRRIGELLGLARRAGQAVAGFQKAREWLQAGRVGLVLQAADGSAAECQRFLSGAAGKVPVATPLSAAALGAVFGREQAVHVAVAPGRLAALLRQECDRLAGVRGADERASGLGAAGTGPGGLNERAGA